MINQKQIDFRQSMSHLGTAVNIITTNGIGGKMGLTVSSVCQVCNDPPTVLACISAVHEINSIIKINRRMAINTLSAQQLKVAKNFVTLSDVPMKDRFLTDKWRDSPILSQPILAGAINQIVGDIVNYYEQGTHTIFIVEIAEVITANESDLPDGLGYFKRRFISLTDNNAI